jgi:capsular polysaccharide transport system permease protein
VFGADIFPIYPDQAIGAIFATIFLGVSLGIVSAVLIRIFKAWLVVLIVILIVMYASSGAFLLPTALPKSAQYWMTWNPLFHCVEWLRSSYYDGYGNDLMDRGYLMIFSIICLFFGLLLERALRRVLLTG